MLDCEIEVNNIDADEDGGDTTNSNKIEIEKCNKINHKQYDGLNNYLYPDLMKTINNTYENRMSFINEYFNIATPFINHNNDFKKWKDINKVMINTTASSGNDRININDVYDGNNLNDLSIWRKAAKDLYDDIKNDTYDDFVKFHNVKNIKCNKKLTKIKNQDLVKTTNKKRELIQHQCCAVHNSISNKRSNNRLSINSLDSIYPKNLWRKAAKELYETCPTLNHQFNVNISKSSSSEKYFSCYNENTEKSEYCLNNGDCIPNNKRKLMKNKITRNDKYNYSNTNSGHCLHKKKISATYLKENNNSQILLTKDNNRSTIKITYDPYNKYPTEQKNQIYKLNIKHSLNMNKNEETLKLENPELYTLKNNNDSKKSKDSLRKIIAMSDKNEKLKTKKVNSNIFLNDINNNIIDQPLKTAVGLMSKSTISLNNYNDLLIFDKNYKKVNGEISRNSINNLNLYCNDDKSVKSLSRINHTDKISVGKPPKSCNIQQQKISSIDPSNKKINGSTNTTLINNYEKQLKSLSEQKFQLKNQPNKKHINKRVMNAKEENKVKMYNNALVKSLNSTDTGNNRNYYFTSKSDNIINKIDNHIFFNNYKQLLEDAKNLNEPLEMLNNAYIYKNSVKQNSEIIMLKKYREDNLYNYEVINRDDTNKLKTEMSPNDHPNYLKYNTLKSNNHYNLDLICNLGLARNKKKNETCRSDKLFPQKDNQKQKGGIFCYGTKKKKASDHQKTYGKSEDKISETSDSLQCDYRKHDKKKKEKPHHEKEKRCEESPKEMSLTSDDGEDDSINTCTSESKSSIKDDVSITCVCKALNTKSEKCRVCRPGFKAQQSKSYDSCKISQKNIKQTPSKLSNEQDRNELAPVLSNGSSIDQPKEKQKVVEKNDNQQLIGVVKQDCGNLQKKKKRRLKISKSKLSPCSGQPMKVFQCGSKKTEPKPQKTASTKNGGFFCCCQPGDCSFKESLKKMFCITLPSRTSSETKRDNFKDTCTCDQFERIASFDYKDGALTKVTGHQ